MTLLARGRAALSRYRSRTPLVVPALIAERGAAALSAGGTLRLRALTSGAKGHGIRVGKGIEFTPGCCLSLGDRVHIGSWAVFEISAEPRAHVTVGHDTWLSRSLHLSSYGRIEVGNRVLIGEFVSLRDTSHTHARTHVPVSMQPDAVGTITIEDGVWVGRGALILGSPEGTVIGHDAIIGANSVVRESVAPFEIVGGIPAHHLKWRGRGQE